MTCFYYTYIIQSKTDPDRFHTGRTKELQERLITHNQGKCKHTSKYIPWKIKTAIAFTEEQRAIDFETYLKTSSGRAFAKKRL
jgi:predicted GIY-YIG superfamily endonuclease